MNKQIAAFVAAGAFAVTGLTGMTAAGAVTPAAAPCATSSVGQIQIADWALVHATPGLHTTAVGQLPRGATFHHCSDQYTRIVDGYGWVYGYGYNGNVKVTGWVAGGYITGP